MANRGSLQLTSVLSFKDVVSMFTEVAMGSRSSIIRVLSNPLLTFYNQRHYTKTKAFTSQVH